jgi:hypothetical protein
MDSLLIQNKYEFTKSERIYYALLVIAIYYYNFAFIRTPFELYPSYLVMFPLIPLFMVKYGIGRIATVMFLYLLLTGMIGIFTSNNTTPQFLKVFLGLFFSFLFFDYYIKFLREDILKIFYVYLKVTYWICIIGVIQFISFQIGFRFGYDFNATFGFNKWGVVKNDIFGMKINSIFSEPAYFGAYVSPALFVVINNFLNKQKVVYSTFQGVIIVVTYVLTFSSLAYIGIALSVFFAFTNKGFIKYFAIVFVVITFLFYIAYNNVRDFRIRVDDSVTLFSGNLGKLNRMTFRKYHGSSLTLYDNYKVAVENIKNNNILFGTGVGSHGVAFSKYSLTLGFEEIRGVALNAADANSLLLRIISELGLVGVIITFGFIFKYYIPKTKVEFDNHYWIISNGCLILIILNLFRLGHYFYSGFPLFVLLYYYSSKILARKRTEKSDTIVNDTTVDAK